MTRLRALVGLALVLIVALGAAALHAAAPQRVTAEEQQALRTRIQARYDVVPLSGGVALRPKSPGDVRLIEIADTIAVNGVAVTGRELRDRVGADADTILKLSYLDGETLRALFAAASEPQEIKPEREPSPDQPASSEPTFRRSHRSGGDRVRVFGDAVVRENEEVSGQVVAVMGSVSVDGEVGDQVVAVMGSVDLGPHAVVRGDVVAVGGRLHRAPGAQIHGTITEVSLGDISQRLDVPWLWGPVAMMGGFGPVARLIGTSFRFGLLAIAACLALAIARGAVEGAAHRVVDNPVKATLIGVMAWVLFVPTLVLTCVLLAISFIGIPLLLLMPFVVLVVLVMALVGFSGSAYAVGQWTRRRFGLGTMPGLADVCLGVLIILLPILVARVIGLAGWAVSPIVFLLIAVGLSVEFLAWACGFGAVINNAFSRWQARRAARTAAAI